MLSDSEEGQLRELLGRLNTDGFAGTALRGGLPLVPVKTALPTASADNRGRLIAIQGAAGVADGIYASVKSAADTYSWTLLPNAAAITSLALGGELSGTTAAATVNATHSGSKHVMILRASNTSEVTTTSVTIVDLLAFASLNIPVTSGVIIEGVVRKSAGAAAGASLGLKVNSTVVNEANVSWTTDQSMWVAGTTNGAHDGSFHIEIAPRSANYLFGGRSILSTNIGTGHKTFVGTYANNAASPNAAITDLAIRAISGNALVTVAVKEVAVYELLYS